MRFSSEKNTYTYIKYLFIPIIIAIFLLGIFYFGIIKTNEYTREQSTAVLEDTIKKAVICCYAVEGVYPESIEYLEENYNLNINRDNYIVDYDIFASNYMPNITVINKHTFK